MMTSGEPWGSEKVTQMGEREHPEESRASPVHETSLKIAHFMLFHYFSTPWASEGSGHLSHSSNWSFGHPWNGIAVRHVVSHSAPSPRWLLALSVEGTPRKCRGNISSPRGWANTRRGLLVGWWMPRAHSAQELGRCPQERTLAPG